MSIVSDSVEKIVKHIAEEILILAELVAEDAVTASGANLSALLFAAVSGKLTEPDFSISGDSVVLRMLINNYIQFLELENPPALGKSADFHEVRDWMISKGIQPNNDDVLLLFFALWYDRHTGIPVLQTLENEIEEIYDSEWAEKLFEAITTELTKYFN